MNGAGPPGTRPGPRGHGRRISRGRCAAPTSRPPHRPPPRRRRQRRSMSAGRAMRLSRCGAVQKNPEDGEALAGLGAAYLQRVRENVATLVPAARRDAAAPRPGHRRAGSDRAAPLSSLAGTRHRFGEALALGAAPAPRRPGRRARRARSPTPSRSSGATTVVRGRAAHGRPAPRSDLVLAGRWARVLDGDGDGAVAAMRLAVEAGPVRPSTWPGRARSSASCLQAGASARRGGVATLH